MKKRNVVITIIVIAVIVGIFLTRNKKLDVLDEKKSELRKKEILTIATGPTSGLYFPIGSSFAKVFKKVGYRTSIQSTGGSVENIELILRGRADLAIAMSDAVNQAYKGLGEYKGTEPKIELRALMGLYPNYVQVVTMKKSKIRKFEDLKGKRVGIGAFNSGVELNARMMYEAYGMSYEDSEVQYLNYGEAVDKMKNNLVDAIFVTSGIPNELIMNLKINSDVFLIPIEGKGMENLKRKYPFFVEEIIPSEIYNTEEKIKTASVRNIMLVRKDLSEETVYKITKGIYENIENIKASHKASQQNVSLKNFQVGVKIPFHKGALKYYREKGVIK